MNDVSKMLQKNSRSPFNYYIYCFCSLLFLVSLVQSASKIKKEEFKQSVYLHSFGRNYKAHKRSQVRPQTTAIIQKSLINQDVQVVNNKFPIKRQIREVAIDGYKTAILTQPVSKNIFFINSASRATTPASTPVKLTRGTTFHTLVKSFTARKKKSKNSSAVSQNNFTVEESASFVATNDRISSGESHSKIFKSSTTTSTASTTFHTTTLLTTSYSTTEEDMQETVTTNDPPTEFTTKIASKISTVTKPSSSSTPRPETPNIPKCPPNMTYYSHFLGVSFCFVLTELQTFPPKCPYENFIDFDSVTGIYDRFTNISIWVLAYRETKDYLGEFKYLDRSSRYLNHIQDYESPGNQTLKKACLVLKLDIYTPVPCTDKYPALCVYTYHRKTIEKFCSNRNDHTKCISTSFDLTNKCFCQANMQGVNLSRDLFCSKLAEPDQFESQLILSQLTHKTPCWFGVEKTTRGEFVWSSSRALVEYDYWKKNIDLSKQFGAFDYHKPKGWILENDCALKCAVCEIEVPYQEVKISLKYFSTDKMIHVQVLNVFDIHNHLADDYIMACFSDYNTDGMKIKVVSKIPYFISISGPNYTFKIAVKNNYPSYYWCETFQHPNFKKVFSNIILVYVDEEIHRHEYAIEVKSYTSGEDPYLADVPWKITEGILTRLKDTGIINAVRPMQIVEFSPEKFYMKMLLHMSVAKNNNSSINEFYYLKDRLTTMSPNIHLIKFARSEVCLQDVTEHVNNTLHWPETNIGSTAVPNKLCLQENLLPVTRKCLGDFINGAYWGKVEGVCSANITYSERTQTLYELLNSETNTTVINEQLCNITAYNQDVLIIDVHYMVEILEKLDTEEDFNLQDVAYIYSNIMQFDVHVLNQSQNLLNSTDKSLDVLDQMVSKMDLQNSEYGRVESQKLFIQASSLVYSNISGIALMGNSTFVTTAPIHNGTYTPNELLQEEVILALYLDDKTLATIQECNITDEAKLVLTLFLSDVLFNEISQSEQEEKRSVIVSVLFTGLECTSEISLHIIFKHAPHNSNNSCAYWKYGVDAIQQNLQGKWKIDSPSTEAENFTQYSVCCFNHTTHFALLMLNDNSKNNINPEISLALNIITGIGCALSLLGILGIFATALAFESWRNHSSNIINLNFCVSIAAQMVFLFVADYARESTLLCYISGASLHYTVLSEFSWMLIIGFFQYRKFVLVFDTPINHKVLKCMLLGWGIPIIPVTIVLAFCKESYQSNSLGLCYPKHRCFYLGVALPVGSILIINFFIFVMILSNVCNLKVESYGHKQNQVKLQVLLAILLYFLLGMSWIFGLAVAFLEWRIWSYLFCMTATLQGFIMFLFFVAMNEKSRGLWAKAKSYNLTLQTTKKWYKNVISKGK